MKIVKKNVYYCEFCKKKSLAPYVVKNHELHCTNNPDRECKFCENYFKNTHNLRSILQEYSQRFTLSENHDFSLGNYESFNITWIGTPITLEEIRLRVNNCPNCILSIIRQLKFNYCNERIANDFKYKEEVQKVFDEMNKENYEVYYQ
jgi:hypothetical protein